MIALSTVSGQKEEGKLQTRSGLPNKDNIKIRIQHQSSTNGGINLPIRDGGNCGQNGPFAKTLGAKSNVGEF